MLLKIHFTDNIPFVGQGVPRSLKTPSRMIAPLPLCGHRARTHPARLN